MLYLNDIVYVFIVFFVVNVMLGCKNVSDVLYTICYVLMCPILCYLSCIIFFMFVVVMFMGGIHYKLFNFFFILFSNMYISSCITCLYLYKLENKV